MVTKSIRLPEELLASIVNIEKAEHIEEAAAIRKLIRIGLERYVGTLYEQGKLSLREAAAQLRLDLSDTIELFASQGITGNLGADDVMRSLESLTDPLSCPAGKNQTPKKTSRSAAQCV